MKFFFIFVGIAAGLLYGLSKLQSSSKSDGVKDEKNIEIAKVAKTKKGEV